MSTAASVERARYVLPLPDKVQQAARARTRVEAPYLSEAVLRRNILWFCRLRWIVIVILATFGTLGNIGRLAAYAGLKTPGVWPIVAAGILLAGNIVFRYFASRGRARANLWAQIVLDLLVLTLTVHFVGSGRTYIAFAYLFHIVLACIVFPRRQSLLVTALACVFYGASEVMAWTGIAPGSDVLAERWFGRGETPTALVTPFNFLTAVSIWFVVWYLASHLSIMVRERDNELAQANRRLVETREEKERYMLRTTHELKAPFAAIHANTQLLLNGYCGELSEEARPVLLKISKRSRRLAKGIQEMLQIANLRSTTGPATVMSEVNLTSVLNWCATQVEPMARQRGVTIRKDIADAHVAGVEDHLKMLVSNLLTNAVTYSHEGGGVSLECRRISPEEVLVAVEDEGIGIPAEKLQHIFEEYYRTKEAVRHNSESTGLGLAIVRQIVELHGIRASVESAPGEGTRFELRFESPPGGRYDQRQKEGDEQWLTC